VVFTDIMSEEQNSAAITGLVEDIHELNPATQHINDPSGFDETDLPTSPNSTFRTTCNMAFGRFSMFVRNDDGVRSAFAHLHDVGEDSLACSWDNPFYTPQPEKGVIATQLHWDHNWYYGGERAPLADSLCTQGVYYASETNLATPSFVCVPGSQSTWRKICELDSNPSKGGAKVLNYLPCSHFSDEELASTGLAPAVRIHVPARALLIWDSRTCHGNTPPATIPAEGTEGSVGRVAFAICYGPVEQRTAKVHKEGLLKGMAGIRTTHHPGIMLAHDKHGYPDDFVSNSEPNTRLRDIAIPLNPNVSEDEFQQMIARSTLSSGEKAALTSSISLVNVQERTFQSYWRLDGMAGEHFDAMLQLEMRDIRRLLHPDTSRVQGVHSVEIEMTDGDTREMHISTPLA
jgi:hypothetical protein